MDGGVKVVAKAQPGPSINYDKCSGLGLMLIWPFLSFMVHLSIKLSFSIYHVDNFVS